jgi:hypothetical protein
MISNTPVGDPEHVILMLELKVLNEALKVALSNLIAAEEQIMIEEMATAKKSKAANVFIDRTIASVLGDNDNDAYAPNNGDSLGVARSPWHCYCSTCCCQNTTDVEQKGKK